LAEYRLDALAQLSGVSVRNIRAYRERGLLDPPRREGRSAYYDDHHLRQLKIINDLLRRGFNSAHIAEFFTSMRDGHDLADFLGLREAIFGRRRQTTAVAVQLDPTGAEARRLCETGLAQVVDGQLTFTNPAVAEIVGRGAEPLDYLRAILRVHDGASDAIEKLATAKAGALQGSTEARFGASYVPRSEDMAELRRVVTDYRDLGNHVVSDLLDAAVERRLVTAVSDYTARVLVREDWDPKAP
jgi:DNA-binding transcriptional MerR regulator